jgi:hypothetical protein
MPVGRIPALRTRPYCRARRRKSVRSRTYRWLAVVAATWVGFAALPASGASIDDPPFAQGPLDLKRLIATKHDATASLHLTIVTYEGWDASVLDVSGSNRIFVLFDPDRSGQRNFIGEIFRRDGVLWMRITRPSGEFVGRVRAFHPEDNIVKATVPHGLPNPDGHSWLAAAEEWFTPEGACAGDPCRDRIPDHGWLKLTPGQ